MATVSPAAATLPGNSENASAFDGDVRSALNTQDQTDDQT
jgi:hypothetical protein